jgi:hypothetical protein
LFRKLKHEVPGKTFVVSLDRLNQGFRAYAIQLREVGIQHHPLRTYQRNARLDEFNGGFLFPTDLVG